MDTKDIPFTELPSGVLFREYREGKGGRTVTPGSTVTAQMSIRCMSMVTGINRV